MTATATLVQRGPINGFFSENAAFYHLSEPYEYEGVTFQHCVVSCIPEDEHGPEDTIILMADEYGRVYLGGDFVYEKEGDGGGHAEALAAIGYELATEPAEA